METRKATTIKLENEKKEIYISVDIETNGPIPGLYSLWSIGAAAFTIDSETPISTFSINLEDLENATAHSSTQIFWNNNPKAFEFARKDPVDITTAMSKFNEWILSLNCKPIMVVYPTWDFMWITWYFQRVLGHSPFGGISCLDIKTLAFAKLKKETFKSTVKRKFPSKIMKDLPPHTHRAIDDAIEQGIIFVRLMNLKE